MHFAKNRIRVEECQRGGELLTAKTANDEHIYKGK